MSPDPAKTRQAVQVIADWLCDETRAAPARDALATAVRLTARTLAALAPGASVEVRIPPFAAVQCVSGPRHTRGTPPNVVETDPRTWLLVATGLLGLAEAAAAGAMTLSGARAGEIGQWLPLCRIDGVTNSSQGSHRTVTVQEPEQDLNSSQDSPREECGVFGVWAPGEEVAKLTYYGLYALQHRGQEAAGIAVADGTQVLVFKDLGLVSQVFDEQTLAAMHGHVAIGHCRYSTTGDTTWENAQPVFRNTAAGTGVALGHNGNLVNTAELAARARDVGLIAKRCPAPATTDSDILGALLAHGAADSSLEQAALELLPTVRGAYCLTFMDENTLYACRDPHGVRPLSLGRLDRGWVVASETAALDIVGASFVRDIEPGELLAIDADGVRSTHFASPDPKGCVFEYVYLARPDSTIAGRSVHAARVEIGRRLARECPVDADLVIGVPESGTPAAVGYAQESGVPYGQGLMKNAYVGRTFIQPSQTIRQLGIRLKLNPLKEVIRGKRLIVVDDSIVRGNTQRALLRMLREAGAIELHVRIASPPVKWPCFYGIDFPSPAELIANAVEDEKEMLAAVRHAIGADSLGYISSRGMVEATEQPASRLCAACFDGRYPIELPGETALGKNVVEHMLVNAARGAGLDDLATR